MNQVMFKLNKAKENNIQPIEITIQLTPGQILRAYQKLLNREKRIRKDWIYQEPFVSELKKRIKIATQEKNKNKLTPASELYKKLGL